MILGRRTDRKEAEEQGGEDDEDIEPYRRHHLRHGGLRKVEGCEGHWWCLGS